MLLCFYQRTNYKDNFFILLFGSILKNFNLPRNKRNTKINFFFLFSKSRFLEYKYNTFFKKYYICILLTIIFNFLQFVNDVLFEDIEWHSFAEAQYIAFVSYDAVLYRIHTPRTKLSKWYNIIIKLIG